MELAQPVYLVRIYRRDDYEEALRKCASLNRT